MTDTYRIMRAYDATGTVPADLWCVQRYERGVWLKAAGDFDARVWAEKALEVLVAADRRPVPWWQRMLRLLRKA